MREIVERFVEDQSTKLFKGRQCYCALMDDECKDSDHLVEGAAVAAIVAHPAHLALAVSRCYRNGIGLVWR